MRENWKWCPQCRSSLKTVMIEEVGVRQCTNDTKIDPNLPDCPFIDWDNPVPVVVGLVRIKRKIVMVQRGVPPFIGQFCAPAGFLDSCEDPWAGVAREVLQESGITVEAIALLDAVTPQPAVPGRRANSMLMFFLCRYISGELKPGSDATEATAFSQCNRPKACFPTHERMINALYAGAFGTLRSPRGITRANHAVLKTGK